MASKALFLDLIVWWIKICKLGCVDVSRNDFGINYLWILESSDNSSKSKSIVFKLQNLFRITSSKGLVDMRSEIKFLVSNISITDYPYDCFLFLCERWNIFLVIGTSIVRDTKNLFLLVSLPRRIRIEEWFFVKLKKPIHGLIED